MRSTTMSKTTMSPQVRKTPSPEQQETMATLYHCLPQIVANILRSWRHCEKRSCRRSRRCRCRVCPDDR